MVTAKRLALEICFTLYAHATQAKKPSKAVRKWDGKTPYGVHPLWCATTLLHETTLPEELRQRGAEALLYHDIPEDTTQTMFLEHTPSDVLRLVEDMTFAGGSAEEMERVWERSAEVRLLKLFDKVSNLLDGAWMDAEKRAKYQQYTRRLTDDVALNYGELNIVRIARALTGE